MFIGQCTEDLTEEILREYFSKFGEISDLYVPKPFRAFAFVTFVEANAAKNVCAQDHTINDTKVYVTEAVPKGESEKYDRGRSRSAMKNRRDNYGGANTYDDYFDRKRPWASREDSSWGRARWYDEPGSRDHSWRSQASSGWSGRSPSANRWRDSTMPPAADANIDPDVVAAVVNKAVMGVIGNLKGNQPAPVPDMTAANGGGDWWSRR